MIYTSNLLVIPLKHNITVKGEEREVQDTALQLIFTPNENEDIVVSVEWAEFDPKAKFPDMVLCDKYNGKLKIAESAIIPRSVFREFLYLGRGNKDLDDVERLHGISHRKCEKDLQPKQTGDNFSPGYTRNDDGFIELDENDYLPQQP